MSVQGKVPLQGLPARRGSRINRSIQFGLAGVNAGLAAAFLSGLWATWGRSVGNPLFETGLAIGFAVVGMAGGLVAWGPANVLLRTILFGLWAGAILWFLDEAELRPVLRDAALYGMPLVLMAICADVLESLLASRTRTRTWLAVGYVVAAVALGVGAASALVRLRAGPVSTGRDVFLLAVRYVVGGGLFWAMVGLATEHEEGPPGPSAGTGLFTGREPYPNVSRWILPR